MRKRKLELENLYFHNQTTFPSTSLTKDFKNGTCLNPVMRQSLKGYK